MGLWMRRRISSRVKGTASWPAIFMTLTSQEAGSSMRSSMSPKNSWVGIVTDCALPLMAATASGRKLPAASPVPMRRADTRPAAPRSEILADSASALNTFPGKLKHALPIAWFPVEEVLVHVIQHQDPVVSGTA